VANKGTTVHRLKNAACHKHDEPVESKRTATRHRGQVGGFRELFRTIMIHHMKTQQRLIDFQATILKTLQQYEDSVSGNLSKTEEMCILKRTMKTATAVVWLLLVSYLTMHLQGSSFSCR